MNSSKVDLRRARVELDELIPRVGLRIWAKLIDFVCVGVIVVGFGRLFNSYLVGLCCGYGWLAISDWFGSTGKSIFKLKTLDYNSMADCSLLQSVLRNAPILAISLPHRLHRAFLGIDQKTYREEHFWIFGVMAVLGIGWFLLALARMNLDQERRRPGDLLGNTIVVAARQAPKPEAQAHNLNLGDRSHTSTETSKWKI